MFSFRYLQPIFQLTLQSADGEGQSTALFSADDEDEESPYESGKEVQIEYPGTVLFTPSGTGTTCLETKSFEIFEAPAPAPPQAAPAVVKRSPGRPRKDGSTPPSAVRRFFLRFEEFSVCGY